MRAGDYAGQAKNKKRHEQETKKSDQVTEAQRKTALIDEISKSELGDYRSIGNGKCAA